jgi:hypothetical protein
MTKAESGESAEKMAKRRETSAQPEKGVARRINIISRKRKPAEKSSVM